MKFLRTIPFAVLIFAVFFTVFIGKNKIPESGVSVSPAEYKGIITLWHIDTFEGGVGSRKQFLMSVARDFEKRNEGLLVMAVEHTVESAENSMAEGKTPDLISYGAGVNVKNIQPIAVRGTRGGVINGETYALCWCMGGYCLIENPYYVEGKKPSAALIVSQGAYTNPLIAYVFSGKTENNLEILSPMNAYVKFVSGKSRYLLGTQRDINRLNNRGMEYTVQPLNGYNDLYQYISVTSRDALKTKYAEEFVEYLVSEKVQKQLYKIGMMSAYCNVEYDSPEMALIQKTEQKSGYSATISAFSSKELIEELQERGVKAAKGDEDEFLKIKKLIVSP